MRPSAATASRRHSDGEDPCRARAATPRSGSQTSHRPKRRARTAVTRHTTVTSPPRATSPLRATSIVGGPASGDSFAAPWMRRGFVLWIVALVAAVCALKALH